MAQNSILRNYSYRSLLRRYPTITTTTAITTNQHLYQHCYNNNSNSNKRRCFSSTMLLKSSDNTAATARQSPPPLTGMKVLDLSSALAGPSCTMYLADMGADVIKLEVPKKGDDSRNWGPPFLDHSPSTKDTKWTTSIDHESTYYLAVNRNKKSISVNLKTPQGIEIAKKLAAEADVLVENFVCGKLEKLGLGYDVVKALNPSIIYCSITGYGQDGPYRTSPGYDAVVGAESGLVHATGEPDRAPVRPGIPMTDINAGFYATMSILASYVTQRQNGTGAHIDVSMFDCQVASMTNLATSWLNANVEAKRTGTGHNNLAPYQVFPTKDSYIMIGVGNNPQFERFSTCVDRPEWIKDPQFANNGTRVLNKRRLEKEVTNVLKTKTTDEWYKKFWDQGFPFGLVNNMEQVFKHPQAKHRQIVNETEHPLVGKARTVNPAVKFNGHRMKVRNAAPGLGEDTGSVLEELGYSEKEIVGMKQSGVL